MPRRPLFYGLCLLAGALLFGGAGLMHPVLHGDGAEQLATIAATARWRGIHWALLFGLPLMYVGLAGVAVRHTETPGAAPARAGIVLAAFGFGVWSLNILFMVGAGWHLAATYRASDVGLAGTHAVFLYDMLHPFGLAAERLATFTIGLVAYVFGWALRNGAVYPRFLAWTAWAVAIVCLAVAVAFDEVSANLYYAQGFFVAWVAAIGAIMLADRRSAPATSP